MGDIFWQIKIQILSHLHMITNLLLLLYFLPSLAHFSHSELMVHNNKTLDVSQH